MLTLIVRVDEVMSSWRVSALLYDVTEDGSRSLLATSEHWLDEYPEHIGADALTATVGTILRWSVMTMSKDD